MAIAKSHTCFTCKEKLPNLEMIQYKDGKWYCKKCFSVKADREWFIAQINELFTIDKPGSQMPMLWKQRQRLIDTYGYTDRTIIYTLRYLFTEKHVKPNQVSLGLVTPTTVDEAAAWRRSQERMEEREAQVITNDETKIAHYEKRIVAYRDEAHPITAPYATPTIDANWNDLLEEIKCSPKI